MPSNIPLNVIGHDFDGNEIEIETAKLKWRPSAYGIVLKDNKILLLRQTNGHDLPGGGVELGETPEAAVIREVKEETGVNVSNPKLHTVANSFYKPHLIEGVYVQSLMMYYVCKYVDGELSSEGFDAGEQIYAEAPEWWPLEKLDQIQLGTSIDYRAYVKQIIP